MPESQAAGDRPERSRSRAGVTALFTVLLVAAEFGLLYGVYHRPDNVRSELLITARLAGAARQATGVDPAVSGPRLSVLADGSVARLDAAGMSGSDLAPLDQAAQALRRAPASASAVSGVSQAASALQGRLTEQDHRMDLQASGIYVGLLVLVSAGWFLWFRRLVARHRALQQAVTEREALATSEQRLLALVQNGADLVVVVDADSTTSFVSPSSLAVVGHRAEDLLGQRVADLVLEDDVPLLVQPLSRQRSGEESPLTLRMRHADGRTIVVEGVITNLVADPVVGGFVITVRDVTERHALQERLTYQAFHDSLTGLANRQLFADRLGHALERRPGLATPLVVVFCDLDNFKTVNDSQGHGAGDRVLEIVGQRIRRAVRAGDTAARLGGDEFAVLMENIDLDAARPFAGRLLEVACEPVDVDGVSFTVSASIGMAQAVPGETTGEEVLRNADVAMYWAKDRGRSTVAVYDSALHAQALDRLELRADLQRALRGGADELVLHYQPTIELESGKISGFEALVRWQHPERGLLSPAFFVPMAEEMGLIVPLGSWVLREACRFGGQLQSDWRTPKMAVNIAAEQLSREDFVDEVTAALAESGLPADRLVLEITESVVLHDLDAVVPRLAALRERGIRIAIDDFGTGYSSLAYLTDLPIDVLKIDKSFIDRVASDDQGASVTEAIIAMSHSMNLSTVAEGVEVSEQAAWLRRVNCPIGQGYFWSRPVDEAGVRTLLSGSVAGSAGVQLPSAR